MVFHSSFFPRAKASVLTSLDRITGRITDFIRGNPIVSTAAVGIGITGLVTGVAAVTRIRKRRKKSKTRKKKRTRRAKKKVTRSRKARKTKKRRTHASPRHKGHKRVSFMVKGKRVSFLAKRKTKRHKHK